MPREEPRVGIILPVYNGMPYLPAAVESVISQSHSNWHLYCIDDGSSDSSWSYLSGLRDPRITLTRSPENLGLYGVLDSAVRNIESEYTVILMQDDLLHPDHLQIFCDLARKHPGVDVFWGGERSIDADGREIESEQNVDWVRGEVRLTPPSVFAMRRALHLGCIWTISGSFTRASYLSREGFRTDLPHASDWRFIIRSLANVHSLYLSEALVSIRIHRNQATNRNARALRDLLDYKVVLLEIARDFPLALDKGNFSRAARRLEVLAFRRALRLAQKLRFAQAIRAARIASELFRLRLSGG